MSVQATSIAAYHSITDMPRRKRDVLAVIKANAPISSYSIAGILGLPINTITRPVLDLRNEGLVRLACKAVQPETGRTVMHWEAV